MSYDTVKNTIALILNSQGFLESQSIEFKTAAASEYGNRYVLKCLKGENQNNTIIDRFDDLQDWQIQVGFARSEQSDITQYDAAHRAKDSIIKALDKPANWEGNVKLLSYDKWEIVETPNYFILDIRVSVTDIFIHG